MYICMCIIQFEYLRCGCCDLDVHMYTYAHIYECVYLRMNVCILTLLSGCTYVYVCVNIWMRIHVSRYVCMYVCRYIMNECLRSLYICIRVCKYMDMYACM